MERAIFPQVLRQRLALAATWTATLLGLHAPALTATPRAPQNTTAPDLSLPPIRWAEVAALSEEQIVNYDSHTPLQYRVRHVDAKGDVAREVIESTDGSVARLLGRDGKPLSEAEDGAERARLEDLLNNPDTFFRHQRREAGSRSYATELLRAMPRSMIWTYAPGQPQLPGRPLAVVLDFKPDPQFKPPSLITEGLTGISGRLWVDVASHVVTRIQGGILHPVDFGFGGLLARVREGGTVKLEQVEAPNGRWLYSLLVEHLTIREVLVHTVEENAETTVTAIQPLPKPVPYRVAIQMLLALPPSPH